MCVQKISFLYFTFYFLFSNISLFLFIYRSTHFSTCCVISFLLIFCLFSLVVCITKTNEKCHLTSLSVFFSYLSSFHFLLSCTCACCKSKPFILERKKQDRENYYWMTDSQLIIIHFKHHVKSVVIFYKDKTINVYFTKKNNKPQWHHLHSPKTSLNK